MNYDWVTKRGHEALFDLSINAIGDTGIRYYSMQPGIGKITEKQLLQAGLIEGKKNGRYMAWRLTDDGRQAEEYLTDKRGAPRP